MTSTMAQRWRRAKRENPCHWCGQMIAIGDRILPAVEDGHFFRYCHLSCAKRRSEGNPLRDPDAPPETPVCKHLRTRGFCLYGDRCIFQHPPELVAATQQEAALRVAQATAGSAAPHVGSRKRTGKWRNLTKNRFRAGSLRRFLLDTFGRERLAEGVGVLDVAGGKGELAFELCSLNGVPATVVEPRDLDLARRLQWLQRGYYHWNPLLASYNDCSWTSESLERGSAAGTAGGASSDSPGQGSAAGAAGGASSGGGAPAGSQAGGGAGGEGGEGGGAARLPMLPSHLRIAITSELKQLLGLEAVGGSSAPEQPGGGSAAPAANDSLPEGVQAQEAGAPPPMPPGWPAALERAREEARHIKWTHKGLQHEGEAAAPARGTRGKSQGAEDGGEQPDVSTASPVAPAAGAPDSLPVTSGAAQSLPAGPAAVGEGQLQGHPQGKQEQQQEEEEEKGPRPSSAQLADVGAFLDGLFARMDGAAEGLPEAQQPPAAPAAQQGQRGQQQAQEGGGPAGATEEASDAPAHLGGVGSFLDELFARMHAPAPAAAAAAATAIPADSCQPPSRTGPAPAAGEPQPVATATQHSQQAPQQQQQPPQWPPVGEQEEGCEAGSGQTAMQLAGIGAFLDNVFARMDADWQGGSGGATVAPPQQQPPPPPPPQQQQQRARGSTAAPDAAAGSGACPNAPPKRGSSAADPVSQAVQPGLGEGSGSGVGGAGVASFLDELFARMDSGWQGPEGQQRGAAAEAAGVSTPAEGGLAPAAAPAAAACQEQQGRGAAPAPGDAEPLPEQQAPCSGVGGAGVASFLHGLFARMDAGWQGTEGRQEGAGDAAGGSAAAVELEPTAPGRQAQTAREGSAAAAAAPGAQGSDGGASTAAAGGSVEAAAGSAPEERPPGPVCREVTNPEEAWRVFTTCSVVVGMHADQATEFIVDLALRFGRPFAVVPCCVFPSQFPHRRLPGGGGQVRTYAQFVQYLLAKAPGRIQVAELPFEGMNKVLYCL